MHGSITPERVLLTASTPEVPIPVAKLADPAPTAVPPTLLRDALYTDPALLDGSVTVPTVETDAYSFAVLVWQVLTGLAPYARAFASHMPVDDAEAIAMLKAHLRGMTGCRSMRWLPAA